MSGLVALSAGGFGMGAIIDSAVNAGESVYQLSTKFGITAGEASQLNRILKLTGSDTGTFATAMLRLDKAYTASGDAGDKCRAVLDATGVSLTDSSGKLLPLNQQLENLSKGYTLAAASGQQEEFIMNTLGARGMALVGTLKNLSEAKEDAAKVTGAGLDPQQMHNLKRELDVISLQSTQVGLALTGALAPVATELFPPIMSGLKSTAEFLVTNKTGVIELTKDALELGVAYKSIQMVSGAGSAMSAFWARSTAQAEASMLATGTASATLTAKQEKEIAKRIAISNKYYDKMKADAVKAALVAGESSAEATAIINEKCTAIGIKAAEVAELIRTSATTAYLQNSTVAAESATSQIASIERVGAATAEVNAVKTASTAESAAACTALVAESSATQAESIATVGLAATATEEKTVAANASAAKSSVAVVTANEKVALSHAAAGNAAVLSGEKTVGAAATAGAAVKGLLSNVLALAGGWIGVIAMTGFALYKLDEYVDKKNKVEWYKDAEVYQDSETGKYTKKGWVDAAPTTGPYGETSIMPGYWGRVDLSEAEVEKVEGDKWTKDHPYTPPTPPPVDLSGIGGNTGSKNSGKSDAEKELEKLQKAAESVTKEIDSAYKDLTESKIQKVDDWYNAEKTKLDESVTDNEAHNNLLAELDATYAEKHRKAYAEMLSNSTNIWVEAAKSQRELQNTVTTAGLEGPTKELLEMQNKYNDALAETEEKYKKLSVEFMGKDKENQTQYLLANPDVKKNDDGSLDFTKRILAEKSVLTKNHELEVRNYHADEKQWEHDLDQAYNNRSLTELQTLLNSDAAIQNQYRTGQTAAMKEYYDLWTKTHRSSMDEMAEAASSFDSGLVSIFTDIGKNVNSAGDLVKSFGNLVLETIWKIQAEKAAANITSSLLGSFLGSSSSSTEIKGSVFSGVSSQSSSSLVERASGGLLTGPGTGTSDSILMRGSDGEFMMNAASTNSIGVDNLNYMNETGKIPGFATGGLVTGPSLSSISSGYSGAGVSGNNSSAGGNVNITVNNNSSATVTATDGGIMDGIRQIIIEIAPDAVLNKVSSSPAYSRNMKAVLG